MALSTYTELKTAIANWLNRSDLTDEISDDFIKLVESEYNAKLRVKAMLNSKTDYSITGETVAVPTGPPKVSLEEKLGLPRGKF